MADAVKNVKKKKKRRLKRAVRKTLGTLFLVSALVIAAIPTNNFSSRAEDENKVVTSTTNFTSELTWDKQILKNSRSVIPLVPKSCEDIYSNEDGVFTFAWVKESKDSSNYIAIILGYSARNLAGNRLTIPDTVDAYAKYQRNDGSDGGYVAVSRSREPLYYMAQKPQEIMKTEKHTVTLADGSTEEREVQVGTGRYTAPVFLPCTREDKNWDRAASLEDFWYRNDKGSASAKPTQAAGETTMSYTTPEAFSFELADGSKYFKTGTDATHQWIRKQMVAYIGNQYLTEHQAGQSTSGNNAYNGKVIQEYEVAQEEVNIEPDRGVFAGNNNIVELSIGENLLGIGNYAFHSCANLETAKFGNGLREVGKYAFANCTNMTSIGLDFTSNLTYISDYTFYNCRSLRSFAVPSGVTAIYDHAFDGCTDLGKQEVGGKVDLTGEGAQKKVNLEKLGVSVFKNCTYLYELVLPEAIDDSRDAVDVNNFEGCTALQHLTVTSPYTSFTEGYTDPDVECGSFTIEDFRKNVAGSFYFEAAGTSNTHTFTMGNAIAFKYADEDKYEIIIKQKAVGGGTAELTYQVNSNNDLLLFDMSASVEEVTIPAVIGPYGISAISKGSFSQNCFLEKIIIPATVTRINEEAFLGCHNLKHVIFSNAAQITYIGKDAFATQVVNLHNSKCENKDFLTKPDPPVLTFTGEIGSNIIPFTYAMDPGSAINAGPQPVTFITYYGGWPSNLVVRYNRDTDKNELVDYPTLSGLYNGEYKAATGSALASRAVSAEGYPYLTVDHEKAAENAAKKYIGEDSAALESLEEQILNAVLNLELPAGIESVKAGLYQEKEKAEQDFCKTKSVEGRLIDPKKTLTARGLIEVAPESFKGSIYLRTVKLLDVTEKIGNHAFEDCQNLTTVELSGSVSELGTRPFTGCKALKTVDFKGGPYFVTANSIIYQMNDAGQKYKVVEFLEGRDTGVVDKTEMESVSEIAPEAFAGTNVSSVDFLTSSVTDIPEKAFYDTEKLFAVYLPKGCQSISKDSFTDSTIAYMEIPGSVTYIDNDAFNDTDGDGDTNKTALQFYCEEGSNAYIYAKKQGIKTSDKPIVIEYTVTFWDGPDGTDLAKTEIVLAGEDATPPDPVGVEGMVFSKWVPDYHGVQSDLQVTATYIPEDPNAHKLTVSFYDREENLLENLLVDPEGDATKKAPIPPTVEGYRFTGWKPQVNSVTEDTKTYAQYERIDSSETKYVVQFVDWDDSIYSVQEVTPGGDAIIPQAPARTGYRFVGWRPNPVGVTGNMITYAQYELGTSQDPGGDDNPGNNPGGSDNPGNNPGNSNNPGNTNNPNGTASGNNTNSANSTLYTLTVQNGSGSGSYVAGSQPIIIADDPAAGQEFSHWTIAPANTPIASTVLTASVITMPAGNVTVTAHYKAKTGVTTGTGNTSNTNTNRPGGNVNTVTNGGTTVVIDKNGLSNTGVVSATVNGSSDNFTIKITDSSAATEAVLRALMAEYGNDLSNIKYFPMDISLYDSTGTNKITDTSGLTVSITLPLPDSLIPYAGNNKVAGVVNDRLDKLSPRFTTINGVACVTFTAEHFSPYVIYVDTSRLSDGMEADNTPKTGDGIHPKWFLSIGFACLSFVMFMQKDNRRKEKVKVKVKARA